MNFVNKLQFCIVVLGVFIYGEAVSQSLFISQQWDPPPPVGKWYELKTDHFVIWYEEKDEAIAQELAGYVESFYIDYKEVFQYDVPNIHILINSRLNISNGSYAFVPPVINFYPTSVMLDSKGYNWNYFLLVHELVHYFHMHYPKGLSGVLSNIFGPAGRIAALATPPWAIEGLAVAMESDYTSSGRVQNPLSTMSMRADILLNNPETYLQSTRGSVEDERAVYGRLYSYGMQLMDYIVSRYGYQTAIEIWKRFMKLPFNYSLRHEKITGKTLYEFHDEMMAYLKNKYSVFVTWSRGQELENSERTRSIFSVLNYSKKGVLVYKKGTDVHAQYMLFDPDTETLSELVKISNSGVGFYSGQSGAISADGTLLVYHKRVSTQKVMNVDNLFAGNYNDMFLYDIQRKKNTRLTRGQNIVFPAISSDKKYVYASQYTHGGVYSRLIRFKVDNPKEGYDIIYEQPESVIAYKTISPNQRYIAFVERSHLNGIFLKLLDLTTGEIKTLIQRDYWLWINSIYFIDNSTLSVVTDLEYTGSNTLLYAINISNNEWTRMARDKVGFVSGIMVGDKVVYSSQNSYAHSVYVYDQNTLAAQEGLKEVVDVDSIVHPVYYENSVQRKLNRETIMNPDMASPKTEMLNSQLNKSRRIHGGFPIRFGYVLPYVVLTSNYVNIGLLSFFKSKNNMSDFNTGLFLQTPSLQVLYNAEYSVVAHPVGTFNIFGSRNSVYSSVADDYLITNSLGIEYVRGLYITPNNFSTSIALSMSWTHYDFVKGELFSDNISSTRLSQILRFQAALPLYWSNSYPTLIAHALQIGVTPGIKVSVPVVDDADTTVAGVLSAFVQVPLWRVVAIKLSAFSEFVNETDLHVFRTERFDRYTSFIKVYPFVTYNVFNTSLNEYDGAVQNNIQSSWALDFLFSLGAYNKRGSFVFDVYNGYSNFFVEQTIGYTPAENKFNINEYLILGNETGVSLALYRLTIYPKFGIAYRIPYTPDVSHSFILYVSIGIGAQSVSGTRKFMGIAIE